MTPKTSNPKPPEICPVCGEDVPPSALACPGCGSDHTTGWNDEARMYDGLDLPDTEFNYDEFVKKEFGKKSPFRQTKSLWWIVALALLVLVTLGSLLLF